MIVRVRSNVGVWRIEVPAGGTVQTVITKAKEQQYNVSGLFADPSCTSTSKLDNSQVLEHGSMVYTKVNREESRHPNMRRVVGKDGSIQFVENVENNRGFRKGLMPLRDMKMHWTLTDFVAMDSQYEFKIKRQETAVCKQVSLDVPSVSDFQNYCQRFAFRRKHIAYLYGKYVDMDSDQVKDDDKKEGPSADDNGSGASEKVLVEAIYEPPQEIDSDAAEGFVLLDDEMEESVQEIASMLGLTRVGWIFCHEQRDYALSNAELIMAAELQLEAAQGIHETPFVTVTVSPKENNAVSVEAFQVSQQCMAMVAEQALLISENPEETLIHETFTAIQEGKESKTVENSFFLVVVPIVQHTSETFIADFPKLNRDLDDRTPSHDELKKSLQKSSRDGWNFTDRLADFNLLIYLSKFLDRHADLPKICASLQKKTELDDGYKLIIKSLAGMEGSY